MGKWIVLLHVAVAFTFVAGIVGRDMTLHKARTSTDVRDSSVHLVELWRGDSRCC